jgi:hypothetical protein
MAIRLRYTINTHLEDRGVTTPAAIGAATALPAAEAAVHSDDAFATQSHISAYAV